jgi:hypothetical protein
MRSTNVNIRSCLMMCNGSAASKSPKGRDEHRGPACPHAVRIRYASGLLVLSAMSWLFGGGSMVFADDGVVALLKANQAHFRNVVERTGIRTEEGREVLPFLSQPIPSELSAEDKAWILKVLAFAGLRPEDPQNAITGYILDAEVVQLLFVALADADVTVARVACELVLRNVEPQERAQQATANKDSLMRMKSDCAGRVLAELPLTPAERSTVLRDFRLQPEVRARLGDTGAEAELIQRFENATDFSDKANAARALGYAGTRRCGEALVRGLKAPQFLVKRERRSVRVDIIEALGKIHPGEPLLTQQIKEVEDRGDEYLGGPEGVKRYLDRIYAWARAAYGFAPAGPEPGLFLVERGGPHGYGDVTR